MNTSSKSNSNLRRAASVVLGLALAHTALADSLWNPAVSRNQSGDKKARMVGDILNVLVQESNTLSKSAKTETAKDSSTDASLSSFLFGTAAGTTTGSQMLKHKGAYPAMKFSGTSDFKGGGKVDNSDNIAARFGVRVVDVLPNNNLIIEGTRMTAYSGETQTIVLRGTVRSEDIGAANSIYSYHISDLSLRYINSGELTDTQRKGWFTKFWDSVSPF